jgi:hypothetical protein
LELKVKARAFTVADMNDKINNLLTKFAAAKQADVSTGANYFAKPTPGVALEDAKLDMAQNNPFLGWGNIGTYFNNSRYNGLGTSVSPTHYVTPRAEDVPAVDRVIQTGGDLIGNTLTYGGLAAGAQYGLPQLARMIKDPFITPEARQSLREALNQGSWQDIERRLAAAGYKPENVLASFGAKPLKPLLNELPSGSGMVEYFRRKLLEQPVQNIQEAAFPERIGAPDTSAPLTRNQAAQLMYLQRKYPSMQASTLNTVKEFIRGGMSPENALEYAFFRDNELGDVSKLTPENWRKYIDEGSNKPWLEYTDQTSVPKPNPPVAPNPANFTDPTMYQEAVKQHQTELGRYNASQAKLERAFERSIQPERNMRDELAALDSANPKQRAPYMRLENGPDNPTNPKFNLRSLVPETVGKWWDGVTGAFVNRNINPNRSIYSPANSRISPALPFILGAGGSLADTVFNSGGRPRIGVNQVPNPNGGLPVITSDTVRGPENMVPGVRATRSVPDGKGGTKDIIVNTDPRVYPSINSF